LKIFSSSTCRRLMSTSSPVGSLPRSAITQAGTGSAGGQPGM
jgi:hypothetical protein